MQKNISVILSAKKKSERLKKVLLGYNTQAYRNFEIIISFEESDNEKNDWFSNLKEEVFYSIKEVYPSSGKPVLTDDLLSQVDTDYIIFASSNSIPRFDFIEQHVKNKEEGFFLVGSNISISEDVFDKISLEDIYSGNCFELSWLKKNGNKNIFRDKLRHSKGGFGAFLNFVLKDKMSFNTVNASLWKQDLICTNENFDNVFFQDISKTLQQNKIKGKQIKYTTVLIG